MPRKKKTAELDPVEKARQKKIRAAERRANRKAGKASPSSEGSSSSSSKRSTAPNYSGEFIRDEFLWLRRIDATRYADAILNRHKQRPYWLSIEHGKMDGTEPVSHFYPCTYFRTEDRVYYGFLFREHRDLFFDTVRDRARKEFTEVVYRLRSNITKI